MTQRTNTRLPTRLEQGKIQKLLGLPPIPDSPVSKSAPVQRVPWDGESNDAKRGELVKEVTGALAKCTLAEYTKVQPKASARMLPMTSFEGAGKAAKIAVDQVLGEWAGNAVLTEDQRRRRAGHVFAGSGAKQNLIESSDAQLRASRNHPVSPRDVAKFYAANDPGVLAAMKAHGFDPVNGTAAEKRFLDDEILTPFVAKNQKELFECDRLGYATAVPERGEVYILGAEEGWQADEDENTRAVRNRKAEIFLLLVHEYIHTLQHPSIPDRTGGTMTIKEGVCEYLTCKVIAELADRTAQHGLMVGLIHGTPPDRQRVADFGNYLRNYQAAPKYRTDCNAVADVVTVMGGENGLLAAYLQGHLEFLGLDWGGGWRPGVTETGEHRAVPMPRRLQTLAAIARATGLSEEAIVTANPDAVDALTKHYVSWPSEVNLPGFRAHVVEMVRDDDGNPAAESWEQIALQHGVSVQAIWTANPLGAIVFAGEWILIPEP